MSLRLVVGHRVEGAVARRSCPGCGGGLDAFVPRCARCGAPASVPVAESTSASLEKPPGVTRLAHLTDLHVGEKLDDMSCLDALGLWLRALRKTGADAVVVSGDLVEKAKDLASLQAVRAALAGSGLAWHVVPGNHDVVEPGQPGPFEEVFGRFPRVERVGEIELLLVDSNAGLAVGSRDWRERAFAKPVCYTEGRVGEAQFEELGRGLCPGARARVLVMHHHLAYQQPEKAIGPVPDTLLRTMRPLVDAEHVRAWARDHGVRLVLHGHKHVMLRPGLQEGLVVLNGGRSTDRPFRARLIDFSGDEQPMQIHEVELPA